ncbi:Mu-like prophage protein gp46 [Humidesulfovibrio mexicanus]|uniref:Mu-like prophage protein gp46 n=1 Tax=Humidesulfovibrio mexicanus TaxID=147047 RepID=A0A239BDI8_9BACT|nr:phage GP46 family protein [Humidesulfovibrio mexicanus]SNS05458.1 Mu-like prophage protein gp46 [Humidesulfovibrio mexicanus]
MDIAVAFKTFSGDLSIQGGDLAKEDGLVTAVTLSLFLDARARDDDEIPDGTSDRRGWWADAYSGLAGDSTGSRLWLLSREKQLSEVLERAREYAAEALDWMVKDAVAKTVQVEASAPGNGVLALDIRIERPNGDVVNTRYTLLWEAMK